MNDADSSSRTLPTAIVSRRAKAGREREFENWLRRLVAASDRAPGRVSSTVQAPNDQHPDEWVAIYQFRDAESRQAWLESPTRQALIADGTDLTDGEAREQVVALTIDLDAEPVTAVVSFRVEPTRADEFDDRYNELVNAMRLFPGFLRCELFDPVPGVQDESVVVFAFGSRGQLDAWLISDERRRMTSHIDRLLEGGRTVNVVGGFGGWFKGGGEAPVKRWKQAAIVLLALYPMVLVFTGFDREFGPDIPWAITVFVSNVVGVAILSWVTMPWLTRVFGAWLRR